MKVSRKAAILSVLASTGVAARIFAETAELEITLKHDTLAEGQTRSQLQRLAQIYPISGWYFTHKIEIDEKAIPHSHPVLTLHTRHLKDDDLLLSSFLHEQIHWFLDGQKELKSAEDDLRALFPKLPVGFPDGADSEESGYLHLLVNFLEWRSDKQMLGELRARQVMEFWSHDHYRTLYRLVLDHPHEIAVILAKHHLDLPASAANAQGVGQKDHGEGR